MAQQSPSYALQNSQHSAALFRQAGFSPFAAAGGVLAPGEYAVTAQSTPNMSVQVAGGRAWIPGTQVSNVAGQTFNTQAGYFGLNDAATTLTIATADPTNPRIDLVYVAVQDAFYSGTNNLTVLGVVTGTPAGTPAVPSAPSNALALAQVRVNANATSVTNSVITLTPTATLLAVTRGGIDPVLSTDATSGAYAGQYRDHPTRGLERWNGTAWSAASLFTWTDLLRSDSYSYTVPLGAAYADISTGNFTVTGLPPGREMDVQWKVPEAAAPASTTLFMALFLAGVRQDALAVSTGAAPVFAPARLDGSTVIPGGGSVQVRVQAYAQTNTVPLSGSAAGGAAVLRYRVR